MNITRTERELPRLPAKVFLNHARADSEIAEWLRDRLRDAGASVWMDTSELRGGDRWKEVIDRELWQRQFVVVVVTRNSVAPERQWVHYEQERALRLLKVVLPCLFEDESLYADDLLPERLRSLNFTRFLPDRDRGLGELIDAIRNRLRRFGNQLRNEAASIQHAFIGREDDLKKLDEMIKVDALQPTGRRIVGIVGMGGLGKTMLAEELVRRLAYDYPGGVLIESRAGEAPRAAEVMRRWVEWALGEPPERDYTASEVRALLTINFGELLVLFDDVSEGDFGETKTLLEALPIDTTRILTTRREDVSVELGAINYTLPPLTSDDALALIESRLRDRFSVSLRQQGVNFEAAIAEHDASLRALVRAVEGHPLALDLGIGTCDYLAEIPRVVERLGAGLTRGVEGFERGLAFAAADRNASLAGSLDHSLEDLELHDEARRTDWVERYRALGVLPDGSRSPRELLCALWGDPEEGSAAADSTLKGLLRRAMLRVDHRGQHYNHPVIRAYAMGLLRQEEDQLTAVRARYRRWVIDRAARAYARPAAEWIAHRWLVEHLQQVRRELASELEEQMGRFLRLALPEGPPADAARDLGKADPDLLALGLELAGAVEERVIRRPQWGEEGLAFLRLGLVCARGVGSTERETTFLARLGSALAQSDPQVARRYFLHALELVRQNGDERQEAAIASAYGELERTQGRWGAAMELLEKGLELHRRWRDEIAEAATLVSVGEVFWRRSDFAAALERYEAAQAIYEEREDVAGLANCLNKIGSVEFNRGHHRAAIEKFRRAFELHQQVGDQRMEAEDLNDLGAGYRYLGDNEIALGKFREACEIDVRIGNRRHEAYARANMAGALFALDRFSVAIREATAACQIAEEVKDPIPSTWARAWRGAALQGLERYEEAESDLRQALEIVRGIENPRGKAGVLGMLASVVAEKPAGRDEARTLLEEAVGLMEEHGLEQTFGGYRPADLRAALAALEPESSE